MYTLPRQKFRNFNPVASFGDDSRTIMLTGHKLDVIARVSSVWETPLELANNTMFAEWADIFTGGFGSQITDLPFRAEPRLKGIKTTPRSICDFWVRVTRQPRLKTTDTLRPFTSDHPAQNEWRRSIYRRHRWRSRTIVMLRNGLMSFTLFYSWLALMMPYASLGRRVAATQDGFFLLVPPETMPDDHVYFLNGGGMLGYVLRSRDSVETFEFIGIAYVHGFYGTKTTWKGRVAETLCIS